MTLQDILNKITPADSGAYDKAVERTSQLIMPPRAMGRLNDLSEKLCGVFGHLKPQVDKRAVFVMAGDHGVVEEGVSAFPQEVTCHMIGAFVSGLATVTALARRAGARVIVTDVGTKCGMKEMELSGESRFLNRNIASGTQNFTKEPAMTRQQAEQAVLTGFTVASDEITANGLNLIATGDMGIGNTTPSSAIGAVFTGLSVEIMTGRGTGVNDAGLAVKRSAIERGLALHKPDKADALGVLASVGGYEIGAIAGVILAAAYHKIPVIVDGIISTAGALIAYGLCPQAVDYMFAGHQSEEPGHIKMLEHMGLEPMLRLNMRLGEGTGAVIAMNVLDAAAAVIRDVATFAEAGVAQG